MLKGVAAIVRDLVEFAPVQELFQNHLQRWRKKCCLIAKQRSKFEAQLTQLWREEPQNSDPDKEYWPARRIYSPDRKKSELFLIPPKLDRKLEKYEGPVRHHCFRSLNKRQDFSKAESFILLAELHDAAYSQHQLGNGTHLIVGVAEATEMLTAGLSQPAVVNLTVIVERMLDLIEARADSRSRNETGKTLHEIMVRSRQTLADLVIRSRPHFSLPRGFQSMQDAVEMLRDKVYANFESPEEAAKREVVASSNKKGRKKKPRGSKVKSDFLIKEVLHSGDSKLILKWLFANEDDLAELCGCSRGTVMKTEFWKQIRESAQAKWVRENGGKPPKMKFET